MRSFISRAIDRINGIRDKESVVYLLYFLAFIAFLFSITPFTFTIDKTVNAVQIDLADPSVQTPVVVTIQGGYKADLMGKVLSGKYDMRQPSFEGHIRLDTIDITSLPMRTVFFSDEQGYGSLDYMLDERASQTIGYIKMNRKADHFIICLFVKDPERENSLIWAPSLGIGKVIVYPAQDVQRLKKKAVFV